MCLNTEITRAVPSILPDTMVVATSGEFNNGSTHERSFYWYLLIFKMCKAGNHYNGRPRALVHAERTSGEYIYRNKQS